MTGRTRRAVVVGAGVGGLATAGALVADGWTVDLLERRDDCRGIGAGLALWPNAFQALDALGVGAAFRGGVTLRGQGGLQRPDGRWLLRVDTEELRAQGGTPPVIVTRPELHDRLRGLVPDEAVRVGHRVVGVHGHDQARASVRARTSGGTEEEYAADLVVAADGIGSVLRALVDPRVRIRPAGYVAWRGMAPPGAAPVPDVGAEVWGRGQRFGYTPLSHGGTYWYATLAHTDPRLWRAGEREGAGPAAGAEERDRLGALFADWPAPAPKIIAATPPDALLRHDVDFLWPLPRRFAVGRLALLGDAAHGMTPDLGQGACLALEDAVELAATVRDASPADVPRALRSYDLRRRPRTTKLAAASRRMGQVAQVRHPVAATLRDLLVRAVPSGRAVRAVDTTTNWRPPA